MRLRTLAAALAAGLALLLAAPPVAGDELDPRESYSYLRSLDGTITISSAGEGPGSEVGEVNQPLLTGDRLRLPNGSRAEVVLADRSVLRLGGGASLTLARVAFSGDRNERITTLDLDEGEILLWVGDDALGDQLPEVRTPGATLYVQQPGLYRVTADRGGWTEVVVREGYAELLTDRGSTVVRTGEAAVAYADRYGRVEVVGAPAESSLERWGRDLEQRSVTARRTVVHVEPELAYAAAPLADYGSWIYVDASWVWRPRVAHDWRPYWNGRWSPTPSGLTWVSYEPWGWVPYHYGTWFVSPGHGWCWRPGRVYSPAWVYWHWSDRWAGWCPIGYYTDFYRPWHRSGFRFGIYGWAGGGWGFYSDWHFAPTWCLKKRDWRHHQRTGRELERLEPGGPVRGVVTTDTRVVTRERLERPEEIVHALANGRSEGRQPLVDVTDFVARKGELPPRLTDAIGARDSRAVAGTPLAPAVDTREPAVAARSLEPGWRARQATGRVDTEPAPVGRQPARVDAPRAAAVPEPRSPARVGTVEPRAPAAAPAPRTPAAPTSPATPVDPRQGWKARVAPAPGSEPPSSPTRGTVREEPVQRVIGGVRRSEPVAPTAPSPGTGSPRYEPPAGASSPRALPPGGSPSPRYSPPTGSPSPRYTPPTGSSSPRYAPPTGSSSPRYTPPAGSSSPRYTPPAGASQPRYTPPAGSGSPRYTPPSASAPRAAPAPRTAPAPSSPPPRVSGSPARPSTPKTSSPPPRGSSSGGRATAPARTKPSPSSSGGGGSSKDDGGGR